MNFTNESTFLGTRELTPLWEKNGNPTHDKNQSVRLQSVRPHDAPHDKNQSVSQSGKYPQMMICPKSVSQSVRPHDGTHDDLPKISQSVSKAP